MSLLSKAIIDGHSTLGGHPGQFPAPVCPMQFNAKVREFFSETESDRSMVTVETPQDEMAIIEELLGAPGYFSVPYIVKTKVEFCPNCGRRNTFLDVVKTALAVHSPQFLLEVFSGKHGHIVNSAPTQRCACYQCGVDLPREATKFSAPRFPTDGEARVPDYTYPVYTYRF